MTVTRTRNLVQFQAAPELDIVDATAVNGLLIDLKHDGVLQRADFTIDDRPYVAFPTDRLTALPDGTVAQVYEVTP